MAEEKKDFLDGGSAAYLEQLYIQYKTDPASIDKEWQAYFATLQEDESFVANKASWQAKNWPISPVNPIISALDGDWSKIEEQKKPAKIQEGDSDLSLKIFRLIDTYRRYGHLKAKIDPLAIKGPRGSYQQLELENFDISQQDLSKKIDLKGELGLGEVSLTELVETLEKKYCSTIGLEFMHVSNPEERSWLKNKFESCDKITAFGADRKKNILAKLVEAEGFELFLDTKYKGAKRFGLDGGESLIAAIAELLKISSKNDVKEIVLGMAHRGRLNVLTQILGKPHRAIFHEFKGGSYKPNDVCGSGDVKYHLGASKNYEFDGEKLHISLLPNPSHLEIVDPVALGKARAKQDIMLAQEGKTNINNPMLNERSKVLPILLHGDAAFAGQGIVQEILAASGLNGYSVAGSLHIIINNQIGFTTNPECSRCTIYASDVAKMLEVPIWHVNGDDVEALVESLEMAFLYRQIFKKPVIVDMYCYRRFGHNEGDEPAFTQPAMYKIIKNHKRITQIYSDELIASSVVDQNYIDKLKSNWHEYLEAEFAAADNFQPEADWLQGNWKGLKALQFADKELGLASNVKTGVDQAILQEIGRKLVDVPQDFKLHKTLQRFLDNRRKMLESGENIDWSMAEALAFGSLLLEDFPIRLSGEDVERGTFSQRHSVFYDQESDKKYIPLNHLRENQRIYYEPINSLLSEEGVLGYEYGYSLNQPNSLVLWEAQFGDFANGAQVVFDQFISSAETKWLRMSGLVCLLPHGFEGQGPEHSSARLERFLQLCAEDNMQVAYCSTPANYFHILRRQLKRNFRKPLILMTPKSLLRHKKAQSTIAEIGIDTSFNRILLDGAEKPNASLSLQSDSKIKKIVICSGKVYYDLFEEREKRAINDIYLLRIEQLYPYPAKEMVNIISRFSDAEIIWCQEEPANMGAWAYIKPHLELSLGYANAKVKNVKYIGRAEAASPAVGLASEHIAQLGSFLKDIFG